MSGPAGTWKCARCDKLLVVDADRRAAPARSLRCPVCAAALAGLPTGARIIGVEVEAPPLPTAGDTSANLASPFVRAPAATSRWRRTPR